MCILPKVNQQSFPTIWELVKYFSMYRFVIKNYMQTLYPLSVNHFCLFPGTISMNPEAKHERPASYCAIDILCRSFMEILVNKPLPIYPSFLRCRLRYTWRIFHIGYESKTKCPNQNRFRLSLWIMELFSPGLSIPSAEFATTVIIRGNEVLFTPKAFNNFCFVSYPFPWAFAAVN